MSIPSHHDLALPAPAQQPFSRPGWFFELKYDGFRVLALNFGGRVELLSRRGHDMAASFPELVADLQHLPDRTAIDGELVVMDAWGQPLFDRLRRRAILTRLEDVRQAVEQEPAALFAFDLLALKGVNYRRYPLRVRKQRLRPLLQNLKRILYAEHVEERGVDLYVEAARMELEGVVAKPANMPYAAGKSAGWVKFKTPAGKEKEARRARRLFGR